MLLSATADLRKAEALTALGYDGIDASLCRVIYNNDPYPHNPLLDGDDFVPRLDADKENCARLGLKILTSHIPYRYAYNDPSSENYDYYYRMTCRALWASEYLGAKWAVVHVKSVDDTVDYVKRLFRDSGAEQIGIAIENVHDRPTDELILAHDRLLADGYRVGICFDTGHCNQKKYFDRDVADTVRELGSRIKMLHVHDNMRNTDRHIAPFLGCIKWDRVMEALADVGYEGSLNLELMPETLPEGTRDAYEAYSVAAGRTLIGKFESYRASQGK